MPRSSSPPKGGLVNLWGNFYPSPENIGDKYPEAQSTPNINAAYDEIKVAACPEMESFGDSTLRGTCHGDLINAQSFKTKIQDFVWVFM